MPKLGRFSGAEVITILVRHGFEAVSQRGSHRKLRHADGRVVIVPMHNEMASGTLASIIRQARLTRDDFVP